MISVPVICFAAVVLVNCLYYFFYGKFIFSKNAAVTPNNYPVSVIVCAKNEAENLKKNVPKILSQQYTNFEVILINDASSDKTLDVIKSFQQQDPRVKIVDVVNNEAFWGNKKYALTLGIKKAKHNFLLFMDADCEPASDLWIQQMAGHFSEKKQLILGYGAYLPKKSLLNRLIRFETAMTAISYFSFAKWGMAYMGVGRNLAYTSTLFYDTRGFMSHMQVRSGDDDLFVNEAASAFNTEICFHPEAFTYSEPKRTWEEWIKQKRRHISTAKLYKFKHKVVLANFTFFNLLFWISIPVMFFIENWMIVAILVVFRILMMYIFIGSGIKKLKEPGLVIMLPIFDLMLVCFQWYVFLKNKISAPVDWK